MKIGILETGLLREKFVDRFDPYPVMFERLLGLGGHDFEFQAFSVLQGECRHRSTTCDGWLITGSRYGVYENIDWMFPLQDFIRELAGAKFR